MIEWRGRPVTDQEFAEWARAEIDRLRQERDAYLDLAYDTTHERDMDLKYDEQGRRRYWWQD